MKIRFIPLVLHNLSNSNCPSSKAICGESKGCGAGDQWRCMVHVGARRCMLAHVNACWRMLVRVRDDTCNVWMTDKLYGVLYSPHFLFFYMFSFYNRSLPCLLCHQVLCTHIRCCFFVNVIDKSAILNSNRSRLKGLSPNCICGLP